MEPIKRDMLKNALKNKGASVITAIGFPTKDSGIALGQAVTAAPEANPK